MSRLSLVAPELISSKMPLYYKDELPPLLHIDDYTALLHKVTVLETKIHRLEVNAEVNGLGENDLTLPWKNGKQEDANTRLSSPNQATKTREAIVLDSKSTSGSPNYNALGAKPKDKSAHWKIRGNKNGSTPVTQTQPTVGEHANTQLINQATKISYSEATKKQPWKTAKSKLNIKPSHQPSVKLTNRFAPLSLDAGSPSDTSTPSRVRTVNTSENRKLQRKLTRPQTLIIGDAAVSEIRSLLSQNTKIFCFPKDMVSVLAGRIDNIIASHPAAKAIVLHAGANDIVNEQSEILKKDFSDLLDKLSSLDIEVFISGPLPPIRGGDMRFSRLWALSQFLSRTCKDRSLKFIDNFNIFWERRHLFQADGLCLNKEGVKMFTINLFHFLRHQQSAKDNNRELPKQKQEITERPRDTEGELPGGQDGPPTPKDTMSSPSLSSKEKGPPLPQPPPAHPISPPAELRGGNPSKHHLISPATPREGTPAPRSYHSPSPTDFTSPNHNHLVSLLRGTALITSLPI